MIRSVFGFVGPCAVAHVVAAHNEYSGIGPRLQQSWQSPHEGVIAPIGL